MTINLVMRDSSPKDSISAYKSLADLMEAARNLKHAFTSLGHDIPTPLLLFLGDATTPSKPIGRAAFAIPKLVSPPRPSEAEDDWIWVEASELLTTNLVLSILRSEGNEPMTAQELHSLALKYRPGANVTSILNAGARVNDKLIHRLDKGWKLIDPGKVPIMYEGYAWGPNDVFMAQEVASFRRGAMLHVLKMSPNGLMIMQIVEQLKNLEDSPRFPINMELVQDDLAAMSAKNTVKRISSSRKWTAA